ncbi:MAG: carboxypeptidase-like regulatory domain-containing protein [Bacteroidota bacterium]|nr:carboxypeptidase-like regulatory domain-containing protein [Bacteroidota bacterium]
MRNPFFVFALVLLSSALFAQNTQTVRGKIVDKETKTPLPGVVTLYIDSAMITGAAADLDGNYKMENVAVGRYTLRVQYLGYLPVSIPNIIVNSGKENIITIEMEQSVMQSDEVVIEGTNKEGTVNDFGTGSGRQFSVEETNRYAGSRGDPARMASNYAGVQGADDSRNDIVVRGNSPSGVLWRLEGVDIPNPNHFAIEGTTGGPVSILNNKVLSNSDFFTGAFPAEYGNGIAAAFDLRMRNGNNQKFEFTGQFGFLGTELCAEGPLNKTKGSSFLVSYRYSTLKLFDALSIPIGTGAVPNYQDGAFKLNFPMKSGGNISVFGVGGLSRIEILVSEYEEYSDELYGIDNRDQYFKTGMGVGGIVYTKPVNEKTFFRVVVAGSSRYSISKHNLVWRDTSFTLDSITAKMGYRNTETKISANFSVTHKINTKNSFKVGMTNDLLINDLVDSIHSQITNRFYNRQDYHGTSVLIQPYFQVKYKPTDRITINYGVHSQYFSQSNSFSVEPRVGARWGLTEKQSMNIGVGLHSQTLPAYVYYTHLPADSAPYVLHNKSVDFVRSLHSILGYDLLVGKNLHIKVETYYQYLYNVPVEKKSSSFSVLNQGSGFSRFFPDTLVNEGTGYNMGVEITIEKYFSKKFFFMVTASLFDAKYKGSDGILRNSDFNTHYSVNMLGAREFKLTEKQTLEAGIKLTMAGRRYYTPVDTAASRVENDQVVIDSLRNTKTFSSAYMRLDARIVWKLNTKNLTHEIGLDLVNVLNRKNILGLTYSPNPIHPERDPVVEQYQLGFLPLFYYKLDF